MCVDVGGLWQGSERGRWGGKVKGGRWGGFGEEKGRRGEEEGKRDEGTYKSTNSDAGRDGGDGAGSYVAGDAAAGG